MNLKFSAPVRESEAKMIKNIVFDFGNVLIKYNPEYMVSKYIQDSEDKKLMESVVFDRLYWDRLDDGGITDEEVVAYSCARLPERLHDLCRRIYYDWPLNLPAMPGMWELAERVKKEYGVRLFLLSNIGSYFEKFEKHFSVLSLMDKRIYSALVGHVKPNRDMFEYLLDTCNIIPNETLFVDDSQKNIDGAEAIGIHGYLFDGDSKKLSDYIDSLFDE